MDNPIRIESPASTALQVIEAHRLFHFVTVIVHGKAMPCRSNMPSYVILCLLCQANYMSYFDVILSLLSHGAHCGLLCLLCHNKPTVCHTMPTRVPCYAYNVILKLQHLLWHTKRTNTVLCLFFHNKPPVCHNLPTKVQYCPYYNILSCSAYSGILCNNKPTMPSVPQ